MSNIVPLHVETDEYFGGCPECGKTNGFINNGPEHWFTCDRHRTKWHGGSNLFSGWREETEEGRFRNRDRLSQYRTVEAIYPVEIRQTKTMT